MSIEEVARAPGERPDRRPKPGGAAPAGPPAPNRGSARNAVARAVTKVKAEKAARDRAAAAGGGDHGNASARPAGGGAGAGTAEAAAGAGEAAAAAGAADAGLDLALEAIPLFGVLELHLVAPGGAKSVSYTAEPASGPGEKDTFHFAPDAECVTIEWKVSNAKNKIKKAKIELFRAKEQKVLWTRELKPTDWADGVAHKLDWSGEVEKCPDFPDDLITLEHSPYALKLSVEGEGHGKPLAAWTLFHVLPLIELELGPRDLVPPAELPPPVVPWGLDTTSTLPHDQVVDLLKTEPEAEVLRNFFGQINETMNGKGNPFPPDRDRKVHDALADQGKKQGWPGLLPPDGDAACEVVLRGSFFQRDSSHLNTRAPFGRMKEFWGDGPSIPILAKVRLKTSADKPVDALKALGKAKVVWDWEGASADDLAKELGSHEGGSRAFLEAAHDYDGKSTKPPGMNCHADRGGKRGPGANPVFPPQKGTGPFPFKVQAGAARTWAAVSEVAAKGAHAGKTGVLFQPSFTAGDIFRVTAYAGSLAKLDRADPAPLDTPARKRTGRFRVWREVRISGYFKKHASIPDIDLARVAEYFKQAHVRIVDATGGAKVMEPGQYESRLKSLSGGGSRDPWYVKAAIDEANRAGGTEMMRFREFDAFKKEAMRLQKWDAATVDQWLRTSMKVDPGVDAKTEKEIRTETPAEGAYLRMCLDWASDISLKLAPLYEADVKEEGIVLLHWHGLFSPECKGFSKRTTNPCPDCNRFHPQLNGMACPVSGKSPTKGLYFYCGRWTPGSERFYATVVHEIGHVLCLAHAGNKAKGTDAELHDKAAWTRCVMSYEGEDTPPPTFCGACCLRLRGWDTGSSDFSQRGGVIKPSAGANKR